MLVVFIWNHPKNCPSATFGLDRLQPLSLSRTLILSYRHLCGSPMTYSWMSGAKLICSQLGFFSFIYLDKKPHNFSSAFDFGPLSHRWPLSHWVNGKISPVIHQSFGCAFVFYRNWQAINETNWRVLSKPWTGLQV